MDNIVSLFKAEAPKPIDSTEFINVFYDWAVRNNIDTRSDDFKYQAGTIATLAYMLLSRKAA
jgi:hypothetical protein